MRIRTPSWCVALGLACAAWPVAGQQRDSARAVHHAIFGRRDAILATGLLAGAVSLMPFDDRIHARVEAPSLQSSATAHTIANDFSLLGDPGTVILSFGTYAVGRLTGNNAVTAVGLRASESLLLSAAATELVKGIAGRARPSVLPPDADTFTGMRGFSSAGRTSFPSGHTSAAFAIAAIVDQEGALRWPHVARIVTPVTYTLASLVGLSRIYKNRHWASDVAVGALVGEYSGLAVERYDQAHARSSLLERIIPAGILPAANLPGKPGMLIVWSIRE